MMFRQPLLSGGGNASATVRDGRATALRKSTVALFRGNALTMLIMWAVMSLLLSVLFLSQGFSPWQVGTIVATSAGIWAISLAVLIVSYLLFDAIFETVENRFGVKKCHNQKMRTVKFVSYRLLTVVSGVVVVTLHIAMLDNYA